MEFFVMADSPRSYGGAGMASTVGDFLLGDRPAFGTAVRTIEVTLLLDPTGSKGLPDLTADFVRRRAKAPAITFRRAMGTVEIGVPTDLTPKQIFAYGGPPQPSAELYRIATHDVLAGLSLLPKRIKSSDDFDVDAFLAHCASSAERLPTSDDEVAALDVKLSAARRERRESADPWELLDVDWSQLHPNARTALNDPFFFGSGDDESPHGNDTGIGLLSAYLEWNRGNRDRDAKTFLSELARGWGYRSVEEFDDVLRDEALIALAFAEIKVRGAASAWASEQARDAIARREAMLGPSEAHPLLRQALAANTPDSRPLGARSSARLMPTPPEVRARAGARRR